MSAFTLDDAPVRVYRRVPKTSQDKHGFQEIGREEKLFGKPTLLCCGGSGTNRWKSEKTGVIAANGYAKIAHALLGYADHFDGTDAPIDIVSVLYPDATAVLQDSRQAYSESEWRNRSPADERAVCAEQFAKKYFYPLVQGKHGDRLSLEAAKRNLRNVHVMAHSYGASFIRQVGDQLAEYMEQILEYSPDEIRQATSQVQVLAIAPTVILGAGKSSFTTIDLVNRNDTEICRIYPGHKDGSNNVLEKQIDWLLGNKALVKMTPTNRKVTPNRALNIIPMRLKHPTVGTPYFVHDKESRECLVYFSQPIKYNGIGDIIEKNAIDPYMLRSDVDGHFIARDKDIISTTEVDMTGHGISSFALFGIGPHGFMPRTIASVALINGMNNACKNAHTQTFEDLPVPTALLSLPEKKSYMPDEANRMFRFAKGIGYDHRIAGAMGVVSPASAL